MSKLKIGDKCIVKKEFIPMCWSFEHEYKKDNGCYILITNIRTTTFCYNIMNSKKKKVNSCINCLDEEHLELIESDSCREKGEFKVGDKVKKIKKSGGSSEIIPKDTIGVIKDLRTNDEYQYTIGYEGFESDYCGGNDDWLELVEERKFCIGDEVRRIKEDHPSYDFVVGDTGRIESVDFLGHCQVISKKTEKNICCTKDNIELITTVDSCREDHKQNNGDESHPVSNEDTKQVDMNILQKFALAMTKEPLKSYRKVDIMNGDNIVTEEGARIYLSFLLSGGKPENFKKEIVDPMLKEQEKEK